MPKPLQNLLALVLVFVMFAQGCVAPACRSACPAPDDGLVTAAYAGDADALGGDLDADATPPQGLERTSDAAALYVIAGVLLVVAFTIDLLLLPFTTHDPFPCCRATVSICH